MAPPLRRNRFPGGDAHPTPQEITFQGCPPGGDGGDMALNTLKNRIDNGENGAFHDVPLDTLITLSYPQDIGRTQRKNWSQSDVTAVKQYEGIAVRTTGYIVGVTHEGTGRPTATRWTIATTMSGSW